MLHRFKWSGKTWRNCRVDGCFLQCTYKFKWIIENTIVRQYSRSVSLETKLMFSSIGFMRLHCMKHCDNRTLDPLFHVVVGKRWSNIRYFLFLRKESFIEYCSRTSAERNLFTLNKSICNFFHALLNLSSCLSSRWSKSHFSGTCWIPHNSCRTTWISVLLALTCRRNSVSNSGHRKMELLQTSSLWYYIWGFHSDHCDTV